MKLIVWPHLIGHTQKSKYHIYYIKSTLETPQSLPEPRSQFTRYRSWNTRTYPLWKDGDARFRNCWSGEAHSFILQKQKCYKLPRPVNLRTLNCVAFQAAKWLLIWKTMDPPWPERERPSPLIWTFHQTRLCCLTVRWSGHKTAPSMVSLLFTH